MPRRADAKRAWGGMYAMDAHGGFGDAFAADGDVSLRSDSGARSHDHCGHSSGHSSHSGAALNGHRATGGSRGSGLSAAFSSFGD